MGSLIVECIKCKSSTKRDWCFKNEISLACNTCKKCSNVFQLEKPTQKTEDIITHKDFLPFGDSLIGFIYSDVINHFYCKNILSKNVKVPVLSLNKPPVCYHNSVKFSGFAEGLLPLEEVEIFLNAK